VPLEVPAIDDRAQSRPVLAHVMWDKLEATPHGRYVSTFPHDPNVINPVDAHNIAQGGVAPAGLAQRTNKPKQRSQPPTSMVLDDYNIDTDPATAQRQFFPNNKKVH
jgi:hypothetical protein